MKIEILTELNQNKKPEKKWLYELQSHMDYRIEGVHMPDCDIYSFFTRIGFIRNGVLRINKGYAYDGMTGYPDSEENLPAGLLHDFAYQTKIWDRLTADLMLRRVMLDRKALGANIAFAGVRLGGWKFYGKEKGINIEYV